MSTPAIPKGYFQLKEGERVLPSDKCWVDELSDPPAWVIVTKGWSDEPVLKDEIIIRKVSP